MRSDDQELVLRDDLERREPFGWQRPGFQHHPHPVPHGPGFHAPVHRPHHMRMASRELDAREDDLYEYVARSMDNLD
ncbi:hypothetical protein NLI96_g13069 [Meripilus lineatus]|uniref:Uncharacterized protein n=1 Tax=Meripilus lineatus TaxID=2056292 RepID=A0AAD5USM5_9APHY|nr:hypothetical protein NLI96_g13069 [Physisporinus lineatus]